MINERYKILRLIGEGRSKVFLAHDHLMDKDIALKVLPANNVTEDNESFREEFLLLKKLQHPGIIKAYDMGTILEKEKEDKEFNLKTGAKFLVLEYVEGMELNKYFLENASEELLSKIIFEVASFLFYLHSSNMIYSDIKPENILVDSNTNELKFIDFGFVKRIKKSALSPAQKSGTILYLAPEILSEKYYDHRADFYSLGVMLYQLIYGALEFENEEELDIYKFHLYEEYSFHSTDYSSNLISIVKKLLQKDPVLRYQQGFEIIEDLNINNHLDLRSYRIPKVFVVNNIALSIINDYLLKDKVDNAVLIKGSSGSGKSSLVEEIYYNYNNVVMINDRCISSTVTVWKNVLMQILYKEYVYSNLDKATIELIKLLINSREEIDLSKLKAVFTQIAVTSNFTIIFDDLGKYDSLTLNLLSEIIPILLVNNSKVIITQNLENKNRISSISVIERRLQAFNEQQLSSFVEKTFSSIYPREEINNMLKQKSDLLPGSIYQTLQNMLSLGIIFISEGKVALDEKSDRLSLLDKDNKEVFKLRYNELSMIAKKSAEIISTFELGIKREILSKLLNCSNKETYGIIKELQQHNILREDNEIELYFTSNKMKSYVYGKIREKEKLHHYCAEIVMNLYPEYDKIELARHFEIGKDYEKVFDLLSIIASEADKTAAYSFEIEILGKLLDIPINAKKKSLLLEKLGSLYLKIGDLNSAYKTILEYENTTKAINHDALLIKGICLCGMGKKAEGLKILKELILVDRGVEFYCEVQYEIAKSYFEMGDYKNAENYCKQILEKQRVPDFNKAKCFSFLGVVKAQGENNFSEGIELLERAKALYSRNDLKQETALVSMNLGNIYYLMNDFDKAIESWELSRKLNNGIGSLREEGLILISMGVFYFNKLEIETAVKNYLRAEKIFRNINNDYSLCLVFENLCESYIQMCEYDNAARYLEYALRLSDKISSMEDKYEIYFYYVIFAVYMGDIKLLKKVSIEIGKVMHEDESGRFAKLLQLTNEFICLLETDTLDENMLLFKFEEIVDKEVQEDKYYLLKYTYLDLLLEKSENSADPLFSNDILNQEEDIQNLSISIFRKYLLAKYYFGKNDTVNAIKKLEEAYVALEDKSITEITWKIIFMMSELSWIRGDIRKAEEYIKLSRSIIEYISNNIGNIHKRETYLNRIDRRAALLKLDTWENYLDRK